MAPTMLCPHCSEEFTQNEAKIWTDFKNSHQDDIDKINKPYKIFFRLMLIWAGVILLSPLLSNLLLLGFLGFLTSPDPSYSWQALLFMGAGLTSMLLMVASSFKAARKEQELFSRFKDNS